MSLKTLTVDAFIEIPKGSQNKYEFDKDRGCFRLDRTLYSPVHYPTDYGYIPETLSEDGDPLDIMVLVSVPTFPGCMIESRLIGALEMTDEKGLDIKILAVSIRDPRYAQIFSLGDVPPHIIKEIEYFFSIYKDLEGKQVEIGGWHDVDYAFDAVMRARKSAKK